MTALVSVKKITSPINQNTALLFYFGLKKERKIRPLLFIQTNSNKITQLLFLFLFYQYCNY